MLPSSLRCLSVDRELRMGYPGKNAKKMSRPGKKNLAAIVMR